MHRFSSDFITMIKYLRTAPQDRSTAFPLVTNNTLLPHHIVVNLKHLKGNFLKVVVGNKRIKKLFNVKKCDVSPDHQGYPLCHPKNGMPTIDLNLCMYMGCFQVFNNGDNLITHLDSHNAYELKHHVHHDTMYSNKTLTNSFCRVCKKDYNTIPLLSKHLARLGIKGFWIPGTTYYNEEYTRLKSVSTHQPVINTNIQNIKLYTTAKCIICIVNTPDAIHLPCNHMYMCTTCYLKYDDNICPVCRESIGSSYQLVLQNVRDQGDETHY